MSNVHFMTGTTGFIGSALALEILNKTDDLLQCAVRCGGDQAVGQRRLEDALGAAAKMYRRPDLVSEVRRRCRAFPMDITVPVEPSAEALSWGRDCIVWHSAASLKFEEKFRGEIFRDNLGGTRNVLGFAKAVGARRFNYISTAYVAGLSTGNIAEALIAPGSARPCNCYEESKVQAESAVVEAGAWLEWRILRPTIVVGHSDTYATASSSGLYGFIREMRKFHRKVRGELGEILQHRSMSLIATADSPLNFIPIDVVAATGVACGMAATERRIFHLSNSTPPAVGQTIEMIFSELGLHSPRFVESPDWFTSLDEVLHDELAFYSSYLKSPKQFDRTNTNAVGCAHLAAAPFDARILRSYIRWFLSNHKAPLSSRGAEAV